MPTAGPTAATRKNRIYDQGVVMHGVGLFTRIQTARSQLERALDDYQEGVYLAAIEHVQRPRVAEICLRRAKLSRAFTHYNALLQEATQAVG